MFLRGVFILVLTSLFVTPSEFWLEPQKFRMQVGEEMKVDLTEGENLTGERWDAKTHQVEKAVLVSTPSTVDLLPAIGKSGGRNFSFKLDKEGMYLVALISKAYQEALTPEDAKSYVEENGLEDIVKGSGQGLKLNTSVYAKLLVQAGSSSDDTYGKKMGMRLELVPDKNPYSLKVGDHIQFVLLLEGKPLPHALIKVWTRFNRTTFLQNMYTENDGSIKFPVGFKGVWMVSAISIVASKNAGGNWENLKASLIFGM